MYSCKSCSRTEVIPSVQVSRREYRIHNLFLSCRTSLHRCRSLGYQGFRMNPREDFVEILLRTYIHKQNIYSTTDPFLVAWKKGTIDLSTQKELQ